MSNCEIRQDVQQFKITTFDGLEITFKVQNDYTLTCDFFRLKEPIRFVDLKPNIAIRTVDNGFMDFDTYSRYYDADMHYVEKIDIDPELLIELVRCKVVFYSTDMAFLYGLDPEYAYDRYMNRRAFKHVKDETKILALQKQGIYN